MAKHPFDEYRKEIKFLVPMSLYAKVENDLKRMHFIEQFAPRTVHSFYFDTYFDDFLGDSVEGLAEREKLRIRYYNAGEGFRFERKIKSDLYGKKVIEKIPDLIINEDNIGEVEKLLNRKVENPVRATAKISYDRKYYFLEKDEIRVTLDSNIQTKEFVFSRERNLKDSFLIEVKCARKTHFEFELPLMPLRFSKYAFSRFAE